MIVLKHLVGKIKYLLIIFSLAALPFMAHGGASDPIGNGSGDCGALLCNPLGSKNSDLAKFFVNLLNQATKVALLLGVLMIIWSGFRFVFARGNATAITKAKDQLMYVLIGIAIILGADLMINIIVNTIKGISS